MIGKNRDSISGHDATDDDDDGSIESNESSPPEVVVPCGVFGFGESRPLRVVQIKADFGYL